MFPTFLTTASLYQQLAAAAAHHQQQLIHHQQQQTSVQQSSSPMTQQPPNFTAAAALSSPFFMESFLKDSRRNFPASAAGTYPFIGHQQSPATTPAAHSLTNNSGVAGSKLLSHPTTFFHGHPALASHLAAMALAASQHQQRQSSPVKETTTTDEEVITSASTGDEEKPVVDEERCNSRFLLAHRENNLNGDEVETSRSKKTVLKFGVNAILATKRTNKSSSGEEDGRQSTCCSDNDEDGDRAGREEGDGRWSRAGCRESPVAERSSSGPVSRRAAEDDGKDTGDEDGELERRDRQYARDVHDAEKLRKAYLEGLSIVPHEYC